MICMIGRPEARALFTLFKHSTAARHRFSTACCVPLHMHIRLCGGVCALAVCNSNHFLGSTAAASTHRTQLTLALMENINYRRSLAPKHTVGACSDHAEQNTAGRGSPVFWWWCTIRWSKWSPTVKAAFQSADAFQVKLMGGFGNGGLQRRKHICVY